ncbi:ABC transporter permease subunit [Streptomyces sp. NP160]|nr:ABC transporter permease subunit [Streptomyces sp. NP160]
MRVVVLAAFAVFFLVPLLSLVEFSTRGTGGGPRTLDGWRQIPQAPGLLDAITASAQLAVLTSVLSLLLLLPTMVWVRLRLPQVSRVVEFLCLLPLTIPAIVLVVGWAPIYLWVDYLSPRPLQGSPLVLVFAYVVLVLPYAYRTLDAGLSAIDVKTLSEAARSLGASWPTVLLRVVAPNTASALLNAALLSVALVLGEFTVASLLNYDTLQVAMNELSQANARTAVAAAAGSLFVVFLLLLVLQLVPSPQRGRKGGR